MSHTGSRSAAELRAIVRERDGDNCCICETPIDFTLPAGTFMGPSLEHVIPVAAGGSRSDPANLRLAHARPCNNAKGATHDGVDWHIVRDPLQNRAIQVTGSRYERQVAAAIAKAIAASRRPQSINTPSRREYDATAGQRILQQAEMVPDGRRRDRGGERARRVRRAKTGARERRGPWGGLIVVEERGPWGGLVRTNYGS